MRSGVGQISAAALTLSFVFLCIALVFWRLRRRVRADAPEPAFSGTLGLSNVAQPRRLAGGVAPRSDDARGASAARVAAAAASSGASRAQGKADLAERLEPAARLLGASGMIVWTCSPDGRELEIAAAYGYSDAFLGRIGPIEVGAPVLTSVAFVEGRARIRARNGSRLAAIAVPIERDQARLGVLTAEIDPSGGNRVSADAEALVRLLASQMAGALASLSPLAARAAAAAQARPAVRPQTEVLPVYGAAESVSSPAHAALLVPVGVATAPTPDRIGESTPPLEQGLGDSSVAGFAPIEVTVRLATPPATHHTSEDDPESTLREARSRFIAGFPEALQQHR